MVGALVLALTGALALGAAMSARRSVSAFDRLREQTFAANVAIAGISDEELKADPLATVTRLLPLIDAMGATREDRFFIRPVGTNLVPYRDIYPIVEHQLLDQPADVPILVSGRLPDPTDSSQIALGQQFAERLGVQVGDRVAFESASADWVHRFLSNAAVGPPDGPTLDLLVTGTVVSPLDFVAPSGVIYLTPAFADEYGGQINNFPAADIRLADPARVEEMVRTGVPNSGDPQLDAGLEIGPSSWGDRQQVSDGLRVVSTALWIFAGVVAAVGLVVTTLLNRRLARSAAAEFETLSALGLDRTGRMLFGGLLVAPAFLVGIVGAIVASIAVAPHTRLGLAAEVEPDRRALVDLPFLFAGAAALGLVAVACTVPSFLFRARRAVRPHSMLRLSRMGRPLPLTIGVRHAVSGGDGRVPSRAVAVTGAFLLTAAFAALVFGASLNELPQRPDLWGGGSDVTMDFGERPAGEQNEQFDRALTALTADRRVGSLMGQIVFFPQIRGSEENALALDIREGEPILTVLAGRAPHSRDEVVFGRTTMRRLGLTLGDEVPISLAGATEEFRLVGQAAFPVGDFVFDEGLAITIEGSSRFPSFAGTNRIFQIRLTWAKGVDAAPATADLLAQGYQASAVPPRPPVVANLSQAKGLPAVLAVFFGVLFLATIGYVLSVSERGRRRQFGVLTALGLRPRQCAAIVTWHAATITAMAALIGVPVGLIAGRFVWTVVAHRAGVGVAHEAPVTALTVAVTVAGAGALVIAMIVSRLAHRLPVADALRAD